jgi:hypothetical protein
MTLVSIKTFKGYASPSNIPILLDRDQSLEEQAQFALAILST